MYSGFPHRPSTMELIFKHSHLLAPQTYSCNLSSCGSRSLDVYSRAEDKYVDGLELSETAKMKLFQSTVSWISLLLAGLSTVHAHGQGDGAQVEQDGGFFTFSTQTDTISSKSCIPVVDIDGRNSNTCVDSTVFPITPTTWVSSVQPTTTSAFSSQLLITSTSVSRAPTTLTTLTHANTFMTFISISDPTMLATSVSRPGSVTNRTSPTVAATTATDQAFGSQQCDGKDGALVCFEDGTMGICNHGYASKVKPAAGMTCSAGSYVAAATSSKR